MGLGQGISNALGGLRATQAGIELTAKNVANANTEGYSKKSLQLTNSVSGERAFGVRIGAVTRQVDRYLQGKVHNEYADFNKLSVQTPYLEELDTLFGKPGSIGSLDTVVNSVNTALVDLANSPQLGATRQQVIQNASYLSQHLRDMSDQIQEMRQNAENAIGDEVARANKAISAIVAINYQLTTQTNGQGTADLHDQLDGHIDDLAAIFDIKTVQATNGATRVFTKSGILLVDEIAANLHFDGRANVSAEQLYDTNAQKRGVGTITLVSDSGNSVDLLQQRGADSGKISGLIKLRDEILTGAQDQLDELAHGLATAFNSQKVTGVAATGGGAAAQAGFTLDVSALQNGNVAEFDFKDNVTGIVHKLSFVKLSSATSLPLSDDLTSRAGDKVFGIDFSGGMASVKTQIETSINGVNTNFTVSNTGTDIQILDDGIAANNVDVISFNAKKTVSGVQGSGSELNFFTDTNKTGETNYSYSQEGVSQKLGFASRIRVNSALLNDDTLLVKHSTTTAIGDQVRPLDLLKKFSETKFEFNATTGIGGKNSPFTGTIDDFTRQAVADQTSIVAKHKPMAENKKLVLSALNSRLESKTKVNVDEEMADLLVLQNAYAANARIVSVVKELMDMLIRM